MGSLFVLETQLQIVKTWHTIEAAHFNLIGLFRTPEE